MVRINVEISEDNDFKLIKLKRINKSSRKDEVINKILSDYFDTINSNGNLKEIKPKELTKNTIVTIEELDRILESDDIPLLQETDEDENENYINR